MILFFKSQERQLSPMQKERESYIYYTMLFILNQEKIDAATQQKQLGKIKNNFTWSLAREEIRNIPFRRTSSEVFLSRWYTKT